MEKKTMSEAGGSMKRRLFVVDDDGAIRQSLAESLRSAGYDVQACATATELLGCFDRGDAGRCVITDVRMPGMSGLRLMKEIEQRRIDVPVVLISGHGDIPMAVRAMKAGAADFIEKPFTVEEILSAVNTAIGEGDRDVGEMDEFHRRIESLTPRERETLGLIVRGHTNKSAAHKMSISPRTVELYRSKIMEKMQAKSLAELVRMSITMNLE
jgi:FixJ family two-component response regulator